MDSRSYAIITPAHNESEFLSKVVESIAGQKLRPEKWIIVDDRSTDNTFKIAQDASLKYDFIEVCRIKGDYERSLGANVVRVFNEGLKKIGTEFEYIVKMDADVILPSDYFLNLMLKFEADANLGISSGKLYVEHKGKWILERCPDFHAVGPCKMYKMKCFNDIGGLICIYGWDILDGVKARMLGWRTGSFEEYPIKHLRMMGSARGIIRGQIGHGRGMYAIKAHPIFVLARAVYRAFEPPFLLGLLIFAGYLLGTAMGDKRLEDPKLVTFLRKEQLGRLIGKKLSQEQIFLRRIK